MNNPYDVQQRMNLDQTSAAVNAYNHEVGNISPDAKAKYESFIRRLSQFQEIGSMEEAKELAKKSFPVANEINRFKVGDARCVIINRPDMFRICVDTPEEMICYNFE